MMSVPSTTGQGSPPPGGFIGTLAGRMIAILVSDGFDEAQYVAARTALEGEGAIVQVVSPNLDSVGRVAAWNENGEGIRIAVDVPSASAVAGEYDALLIPGGDQSVEAILLDEHSVRFALQLLTAAQPIGCIGEAVAVPIRLGSSGGRRLAAPAHYRTSPDSSAINLVDEPVVLDGPILTTRGTADLGAFLPVFVDLVARSPRHARPAGTPLDPSQFFAQTRRVNGPAA